MPIDSSTQLILKLKGHYNQFILRLMWVGGFIIIHSMISFGLALPLL